MDLLRVMMAIIIILRKLTVYLFCEMNNLREKIREWEDLLDFLIRYQTPFNGYKFIIEEIKELKIRLATLEAEERIKTRILATSN
jgi:hypothetical protein